MSCNNVLTYHLNAHYGHNALFKLIDHDPLSRRIDSAIYLHFVIRLSLLLISSGDISFC